MNASESELRTRNLRMLAGLAGLFLLPLALAFWMYYGTGWRPLGTVNHGELISPVRSLPESPLQPAADTTAPADLFHHRWSLIYVGDGQCDEQCRKALYLMRQTRLSLNNEMTRVQRVFLATAGCCARDFLAQEHPGLLVFDASGAEARSLLAEFPDAGRTHALFIVDPLGNLMMRFDTLQDPKGLLQDLKKLLTLSQVG